MLDLASPKRLLLPPPEKRWSGAKVGLKLLAWGGLAFLAVFLPPFFGKSLTAVFSWKYLFVFLWLSYVWLLNLGSSATLLLGIALLLGLPFVLSLKAEILAEPLSVLAFVILVLGVFQQLVELLGESKAEDEVL